MSIKTISIVNEATSSASHHWEKLQLFADGDLVAFRQDLNRMTGSRLMWLVRGRKKSASISTMAGFCVMYVAKFSEAVYVLHCFKKKTTSTSKHDKDIAATRYKAAIQERKQ